MMVAPESKQAITVFFSYAHEDEALRDKLANHLKIMERLGEIEAWYDRDITAGDQWKTVIEQQLLAAQVILLLVSDDFLASDFCWSVELKQAMQRHEQGDAVVIPVILREVEWKGAPFGVLQALPKDAKPVTNWSNQDQAFTDVARGIRSAVKRLWEKGHTATQPPNPSTLSNPAATQAGAATDQPANHLQQTNTGHSTGWQLHVSGGTVNIHTPTTGQASDSDQPRSTSQAPAGSLTTMQRQRLEDRRDALEQERQLRSAKLKQLRSDYAIESGTAIKFQLQQQIQAEETQLTQLEAELNRIELALSNGVALDSPGQR